MQVSHPSSIENMLHVWLTDCDSLYEHFISPRLSIIDNKRLAIDLMALRQLVWERSGERTQYIDHGSGDYPRWIDTSTMIADPLTKAMISQRMELILMNGQLDLRPTPESLMIKGKNRNLRQEAKNRQSEVYHCLISES